MPFVCPNCGHQLTFENFHGVELEACPNCRGIWFRQDQLQNLLRTDSKVLEELGRIPIPPVKHDFAGPSSLRCPEDGAMLRQYHYMYNSPVVLEQCDQCGGFFVRHEQLAQMQNVLNQSTTGTDRLAELTALAAKDEAEHYAYLNRQSHLTAFFSMLDAYRPGWWGLL